MKLEQLPLWEQWPPPPPEEPFGWWLLRGLGMVVLTTVGTVVLPVLVHVLLFLAILPVAMLVMWLARHPLNERPPPSEGAFFVASFHGRSSTLYVSTTTAVTTNTTPRAVIPSSHTAHSSAPHPALTHDHDADSDPHHEHGERQARTAHFFFPQARVPSADLPPHGRLLRS